MGEEEERMNSEIKKFCGIQMLELNGELKIQQAFDASWMVRGARSTQSPLLYALVSEPKSYHFSGMKIDESFCQYVSSPLFT